MKKSGNKKIIVTILIVIFLLLACVGVPEVLHIIDKNNSSKNNNNNQTQETINNSEDTNKESSETNKESSEKETIVIEDEEYFTVTFALDSINILQSTLVKKGDMPLYLGKLPTKQGYKFVGWSQTIKPVIEDVTYFARFTKIEEEKEEEEPYYPPAPTQRYTITVIYNVEDSEKYNPSTSFTKKTFDKGAVVDVFVDVKQGYAVNWGGSDTANPKRITVTRNLTLYPTFVSSHDVSYNDYNDYNNTDVKLGTPRAVRISSGETIKIVVGDKGTISNSHDDIIKTVSQNLDLTDSAYIPQSDDYTFLGYEYNGSVSPKTFTAKYRQKVEIKTKVLLEDNKTIVDDYSFADTYIVGGQIDQEEKDSRKYDKGSKVYLFAKPKDDGYDFVKWSDGNYSNPREITASKDVTYTAIFRKGLDYFYLDNTGENPLKITMNHNNFDDDVFVKDKEAWAAYKALNDGADPTPTEATPAAVDQYFEDYYEMEYSGVDDIVYAPEVQIEYRIDDVDTSDGYVVKAYGDWKSFNNPEYETDQSKPFFVTFELGKDQRVCFRATKNKESYYINNHFCNVGDLNPGPDNKEFFTKNTSKYVENPVKNKPYSQISQRISGNLFSFAVVSEGNDSTLSANGSLLSLLNGTGDNSKLTLGNEPKQNYYFSLGCLFYGSRRLTNINNLTPLPEETTIGCYYSTFRDIGITEIPDGLIPSKSLKNSCYAYMFAENIKLITIPETLLPAGKEGEGNIAGRCYWYMFKDCTELVEVPYYLLPASDLTYNEDQYDDGSNCYTYMFGGCTKLTTPPILSASTLSTHCYEGMFAGCIALQEAPSLLVDQNGLVDYCYSKMFNGCSSLKHITVGFSTFDGINSTALSKWVEDVSTRGEFTWLGSGSYAGRSVNTIPEGWTIETPPAFTLLPELQKEVEGPVIIDESTIDSFILYINELGDESIKYDVYLLNNETNEYVKQEGDFSIERNIEEEFENGYYLSNDNVLDLNDNYLVDVGEYNLVESINVD